MGEYKRKFGVYAAWNYELKLDEFNEMSEQGWQLLGVGLFSRRYKKNAEVRYRYQMDFHPNIEDKGRYLETYREQGWEYVSSTFNGWYYFRKLYDQSFSEEEYEIFTDTSSRREMNNRWLLVGIVLSLVLALLLAVCSWMMITQPDMPFLVCILYISVLLATALRGIVVMRKTKASKRNPVDKWLMNICLVTVFVGTVGNIWLLEKRPQFGFSSIAESRGAISKDLEEATGMGVFKVNYRDNYYLDVEADAVAPFCISLVDEKGTVIYEVVTEPEYKVENIRLQLEKGTYSVYFSDFPGGKMNVTLSIN